MKKIIKLFMAALLIFTLYTPTGSHASEASNEEGFAYTDGEDPSIAVLDDGLVVSVQLEENQLTYSLGEYKGNTEYGYMHWNDSVPYGDIYNDEKPSSISIDTLPNGDVIQVYEFVDTIYYSLGRYEEGKINWYSSYKYFGVGEHPSLTIMDNGHLILVNEGLNTDALWYGYGTFENDEVTWHRNMVTFDKGLEPSVSALNDGKIIVTHKEELNGNLWSTIGTIDPDKKMVEFESAVRYESQSSNNPVSLQLDNGGILTMFDSNQSNGAWNRMGEVPEGGSSIEWTTNTYHQFDGKNNDIVQLQNGIFLNVHEDHSSNTIRYQLGKYDDDHVDWMASFEEPIIEEPIPEEPIPIEWSPPPPPDSNIPPPTNLPQLEILDRFNVRGHSVYSTGKTPSITVLKNGLVLSVMEKDGKLNYQLGENYDFRMYWTGYIQYGEGKNPSIALLENGHIIEMHEGPNNGLYYNLGEYTGDNKINWYSKDNYYATGDKPNVTVLRGDGLWDSEVVVVNEGWGPFNDALYYGYGTIDGGTTIDWVTDQSRGRQYDKGHMPSVATLDNGLFLKSHKSQWNSHLWQSVNKLSSNFLPRVGDQYKYEPNGSNNPVSLQLNNGFILNMFDDRGSDKAFFKTGTLNSSGESVDWTSPNVSDFEGENIDVVQLKNGYLLSVHEDPNSDSIRYSMGRYKYEGSNRVVWWQYF